MSLQALLLLSYAVATKNQGCQEAVKRFFEFDGDADYASGITIPMGSGITFVYPSYLGLYQFKSQHAYNDCNMNESKIFGKPGSGHRHHTFPYGNYYFTLDEYCGRGRKLAVKVVRCAPCNTLYLDAPCGFGTFKKDKPSGIWMSHEAGHTIRLEKDNWMLFVEQHSFSSTASGASDHPLQRTLWKHNKGVEFEIVIHCDVCKDDVSMECGSILDGYCKDETYSSLMRMYCPQSCGFCDLMQKGFALTTKSIEIHTNVESA